jgi:hypothetical protein
MPTTRHSQQLDAVSYQPMTTTTGRLIVLRKKGLTVNQQISARSLDPGIGSFIQDLTPLLTKQETQKTKAAIDHLPYIEKLATLTLQYLELSLPLPAALRAADADL